ncbi:hypothetical protein FQA39_LY04213 [Lamprigera yunnana]|nr:hypothetical protein FQA39_LY04213 [Lamprigera yunnana]
MDKSINKTVAELNKKVRRQMAKEDKRATEEYSRVNKQIRKKMKCLKQKMGKKLTYVLRNKKEKVIYDRDEILEAVDEFYTTPYECKTPNERNRDNIQIEKKIINAGSEEQLSINIEEVKRQ